MAQTIMHTQSPDDAGKQAIALAPLSRASWHYFTQSNYIPASQQDRILGVTNNLPDIAPKNYGRLGLLACIAAILLLYGCFTIIQTNSAANKKSDPTLSTALGYLPSQRKQNKLRRLNPAPNTLLLLWLVSLAIYQCAMLFWWTQNTAETIAATPLLNDIKTILAQYNIDAHLIGAPNTLDLIWQFIVNMMAGAVFVAFQFMGQRKRHIKTFTITIAIIAVIQIAYLLIASHGDITLGWSNQNINVVGVRYDIAQSIAPTDSNILSLLLLSHGLLPCMIYAAGWGLLMLHHLLLIKKRAQYITSATTVIVMIIAPVSLLLPSAMHLPQQFLYMTLMAYLGFATGIMHHHKKRRFHFHT